MPNLELPEETVKIAQNTRVLIGNQNLNDILIDENLQITKCLTGTCHNNQRGQSADYGMDFEKITR